MEISSPAFQTALIYQNGQRADRSGKVQSQFNQADFAATGNQKETDKVASAKEAKAAGSQELTEAEKKEVQRLKQADAKVRNHERAHIVAGGQYVRGGANYQYTRGPDGKNYAVGGEVSIDTSKEREPEATIRKMQAVRRAAMAPADPSPQDRAVAARASQLEAEARSEKMQEERAARESDSQGPRGNNPLLSAYRNAEKVSAVQQTGAILNISG